MNPRRPTDKEQRNVSTGQNQFNPQVNQKFGTASINRPVRDNVFITTQFEKTMP